MNEQPHLDQEIVRLIDETKDERENNANGYFLTDIKTGAVVIGGVRINFETRTVLDGKLKMILPTDFQSIPPEKLYKREARPDVLLAGDDGAIQITLAHTKKTATGIAEVTAHKTEVQKILQALNASLEWQDGGLKEIHGKQVDYFEFITPMLGARVYNLTFFMELHQRVLSGSFVCTDRKLKAWKPIFDQMLASVEEIASEVKPVATVRRDCSGNSFRQGQYAVYHGREYRLFKIGVDQYRLVSTDSKDLENGFATRDGVYLKTVTKGEITAAYELKLIIEYRGHRFGLGRQQQNRIELVAQNCDYQLVQELQLQMSGPHEYVRWVAKTEIDNVIETRFPVAGFAMPETLNANEVED